MVLGPLSGRARSVRRLALAGVLVASVLGVPVAAAPARADVTYVPWSSYLRGWTDEYVPSSANECAAGKPNCTKHMVKELDRVLQSIGASCSHHAVFALAYTRISQTYAWTTGDPEYYDDVRFANHQAAVFAKYYTDAFTNWRYGKREAVPKAWLTAFDAAAAKKVTGTGDLLLGMNAHINRDLPYVVAAVGLVAPDGTSRKHDFDQVEHFLAKATKPLVAESAQRFDPTMDDGGDPLDATYSLVMQVISVWREQAWRNAERLVSATTPEARARVEADIEAGANATASSILLTQQYLPLLSSSSARDRYCSAHHTDTAPTAYPFGTPAPYGS